MTVQFSEVLYNPTRIIVATLNNDNTFGTPVDIDYFEKASFDWEADEDEIKSGGMIVEKLSIATKASGTLSNGAMNFAARSILEGDTPTSVYGVTPNRYQYVDTTVGGQGNPYFALLMSFASTFGGNVLVGFPKAMLTKKMGNDVDQNKFRVGEAGFEALTPNPLIRRVARTGKFETAQTMLLTSGYLTAFFNGMM